MKYYNLSVEETLKNVNSNFDGLTDDEVKQRLILGNKNILLTEKKKPLKLKFLEQFNDLMIIVLLISAIVSFILSYINNESYMDSIIIIIIVIINAIVGFIQEIKADKAIDALKDMQVHNVTVKRNNKILVINSEELVKGDIIILEAGDTVPADARVIWKASLSVDESSLTGESNSVEKDIKTLVGDIPLAERNNMIYSGTNVVYGKCIAVVTSIGMDTELGVIAKSLNTEIKEITPLQKKINGISKFLSLIIFIIIFIMFLIGIIKGMSISQVILLSISLAVAAIPEGLPAVITITLSLGVSALAKKNAIVRKMSSVETLGCTEIICSDKTGTITQNKMKVMEVFSDNRLYLNRTSIENDLLLLMMSLNNDIEKNNDQYIGDPTEIAMYEYCEKCGLNVKNLKEKYKRIDEIPFDSERKMMSTIHDFQDKIRMITKGSFDSIINNCSKILENDNIIEITDKKKEELKKVEINESNKAYRLLAFAYKDLSKDYIDNSEDEENLIFVGMVGMIDPPRENVKEAIEMCKYAHIKPIMITGDSLNTASAIAKNIGILNNDNEAIVGSELDKYSDEELKEVVKKYSVYARVSPMNKLSIVNAWKANNKIVAMTGDGVNDAPALKNADIGVGMGITGTEVSKSVSDIVLADDSFTTIVEAVKEGRRIFDNIRNVLVYLLTGNIAEVVIVFIGMFFGLEIFLPIQLLYINLVTDSMPAISLAFEDGATDIMNRNVRKNDKSFFTPFIISKITISAILKVIAILSIYFISLKVYNLQVATTMAFLCLTLTEMIFAFSCRNIKYNIINKQILKNKFLNNSMLLLLIIQMILFFTPLREMFKLEELSLIQILCCLEITFVIFIIDELLKKVLRKKIRD